MKHNLSKVKEVVHVARCQWVVGTDAEGNDIVPFGLLWERKSFDDAAIIVEEHGAKTYGEGRQYHVWLERVTRHDDGSEESVVVREYNRPAETPAVEPAATENLGTIWVCMDCMLHHANGECGGCHEGHDQEPLSAIEAPFTVAMGMDFSFHGCGRENGEDVLECDCETNTFSTSQCEGCSSYLHGERHAMTLFKN